MPRRDVGADNALTIIEVLLRNIEHQYSLDELETYGEVSEANTLVERCSMLC